MIFSAANNRRFQGQRQYRYTSVLFTKKDRANILEIAHGPDVPQSGFPDRTNATERRTLKKCTLRTAMR